MWVRQQLDGGRERRRLGNEGTAIETPAHGLMEEVRRLGTAWHTGAGSTAMLGWAVGLGTRTTESTGSSLFIMSRFFFHFLLQLLPMLIWFGTVDGLGAGASMLKSQKQQEGTGLSFECEGDRQL
ncbi:hypothetical protein M0R45_035655 [Rubus argutus]|uniref:Uncharacterized protein n=1 Tax=Rubus argutus TaxID=59490 RepID=A0AAW1VY40_RUBAR